MAAEQPSADLSSASHDEARRDGGVRRWLLLGFLALYLLTSGGHFYASDDTQKLQVLQSLFAHGHVAIEDGWMDGQGGKTYSWFPLGASLVMLPGFLLGQLATTLVPALPAEYVLRFFVGLENAFFSAALVALVYGFCRRLGRGIESSAFAAVSLGLATMVWPYAKTAWSEPAAALLIFGGLGAMWRDAGTQGRWLAVSGTCLALAFFVRQELALVGIGAFAWYLARWHASASLGASLGRFVPAFGVIGALTLWYNHVRYGHPLYFPNYQLPKLQVVLEEGRFSWSLRNAFQYTLSPNQGLLFFSPPAALGALALAPWSWRHGELAWLWLAALGPVTLFYMFGWGLSSWAWGLRYVYVIVPFLVVPLALMFEAGGRLRALAVAALAAGVLVQGLGVLHDFNRLYERELARHPELTIQQIMIDPAHSPLRLALEATPATLARGAGLLQSPPAPRTLDEMRTERHHVPDVWPFLQLLSPLPRALPLGASLALLGALGFAASRLWRHLRPRPLHRGDL